MQEPPSRNDQPCDIPPDLMETLSLKDQYLYKTLHDIHQDILFLTVQTGWIIDRLREGDDKMMTIEKNQKEFQDQVEQRLADLEPVRKITANRWVIAAFVISVLFAPFFIGVAVEWAKKHL